MEWSYKQTGGLKAGCGKLVFSLFYNIGVFYIICILYKCVYINSIYVCLFRKIKEIKTYICIKKHMPDGVCLLDDEIECSHPVGRQYKVWVTEAAAQTPCGGNANRGKHTLALPAPATSCRQIEAPSGGRSQSRTCKLPKECQKILREGVPCGECYHSLVQPSHIILLLDLPSFAWNCRNDQGGRSLQAWLTAILHGLTDHTFRQLW